jgi:hypothetical protein
MLKNTANRAVVGARGRFAVDDGRVVTRAFQFSNSAHHGDSHVFARVIPRARASRAVRAIETMRDHRSRIVDVSRDR